MNYSSRVHRCHDEVSRGKNRSGPRKHTSSSSRTRTIRSVESVGGIWRLGVCHHTVACPSYITLTSVAVAGDHKSLPHIRKKHLFCVSCLTARLPRVTNLHASWTESTFSLTCWRSHNRSSSVMDNRPYCPPSLISPFPE